MVYSVSNERKGNKNKNLVIKQTSTILNKPVILVIISILGVASIYSSPMLVQRAIAIASEPVCTYNTSKTLSRCCWSDDGQDFCLDCKKRKNGTWGCGSVYPFNAQLSPTVQTPPSKTCPDGSTPDVNGNCPPVTQGPKGPLSSTDQGTTLSPDNTPFSKPKLPKGGDILETPQTDQGVQ